MVLYIVVSVYTYMHHYIGIGTGNSGCRSSSGRKKFGYISIITLSFLPPLSLCNTDDNGDGSDIPVVHDQHEPYGVAYLYSSEVLE